MSYYYQPVRWMMFIDGENFTIRSQKRAAGKGIKLEERFQASFKRDVWFWPYPQNDPRSQCETWTGQRVSSTAKMPLAIRCNYYTSTQGASDEVDNVRDAIQEIGFAAHVFHKKKGMRAKGVDISLTKDLLMNAALDNYDSAILVAGDADFVPVVEEVQRLGKTISVAFFSEKESGMSPALRRSADFFFNLDSIF